MIHSQIQLVLVRKLPTRVDGRFGRHFWPRWSSSSKASNTTATTTTTTTRTPLVEGSNALLSYPDDDHEFHQRFLQELCIHPPHWKDPQTTTTRATTTTTTTNGGIAVIGRNGSGKTLLGKAILATSHQKNSFNPFLRSGSLCWIQDPRHVVPRHLIGRAGRPPPKLSSATAQVSFDSHKEILEQVDEITNEPLTAFKTITLAGHSPGRLNPAARFLVVRFGLYPLLHRKVTTLSTGEIRKVLLVRALSQKPNLLVLDNAFDGLDVPSRRVLQEIISKTLKGFSNDLLVQGVSSKDTQEQTQVLLMTHRAQELDEIAELDAVAWWEPTMLSSSLLQYEWKMVRRTTFDAESKDAWTSGAEIMLRSMGRKDLADESSSSSSSSSSSVSRESVEKWWTYGSNSHNPRRLDLNILVETKNLRVQKGSAVLLQDLSWTVHSGERWIVGGGNGAGKSTLSRLLASNNPSKEVTILPNFDSEARIGWVSTESHMLQQQKDDSDSTVRDLLRRELSQTASWEHTIRPVLEWLGLVTDKESLLDRPFQKLSQGEQKLVLIASALALRPPLLVLDEPCQGLDWIARQKLLETLERICQATNMGLIYITHHLDEEQIPSITHALHLKDRSCVYRGSIEGYAPENYLDDTTVTTTTATAAVADDVTV